MKKSHKKLPKLGIKKIYIGNNPYLSHSFTTNNTAFKYSTNMKKESILKIHKI